MSALTIGKPRLSLLTGVHQQTLALGWAPLIAVWHGFVLVMLALVYSLARQDEPAAEPLYWVGLIALFAPVAWRLLTLRAERAEALTLLLSLGVALQLARTEQYPLGFAYADEFAHWRTVTDILQTGHLFTPNSVLPASAYYPGLESVTAALSAMTGLSVFAAGMWLIGIARVLLLGALFFFYERVSDDSRVAGIATLVYITHPNFLYFDGQFSYESFALPMAALALCAAAFRVRSAGLSIAGLTVLGLGFIAAAVVTHHLTSYMLALFLVVWVVAQAVLHLRRHHSAVADTPWDLAVFAVAAAGVWFVTFAGVLLPYLAPNFTGSVDQMVALLTGGEARQLFRTATGAQAGPLEQAVAFGSVLLALTAIPAGAWVVWKRYPANAPLVTLVVVALAYPAALAFRLTRAGAEASNRSSEFVFVGIGALAALAVVHLGFRARQHSAPAVALAGAGALLLFTGGVVIGWAPWARIPGPYLVTADPRSVEAESELAASWTAQVLGADNRVATDRTNRLQMGSVGQQHVVTGYGDGVPTYQPFFATTFGAPERTLLRSGQVRYLVVDTRLAVQGPKEGNYFERGEPKDPAGDPLRLVDTNLAKFDSASDLSRIFDSGSIAIYDLQRMTNGG